MRAKFEVARERWLSRSLKVGLASHHFAFGSSSQLTDVMYPRVMSFLPGPARPLPPHPHKAAPLRRPARAGVADGAQV
jgi:hypothetical protein